MSTHEHHVMSVDAVDDNLQAHVNAEHYVQHVLSGGHDLPEDHAVLGGHHHAHHHHDGVGDQGLQLDADDAAGLTADERQQQLLLHQQQQLHQLQQEALAVQQQAHLAQQQLLAEQGLQDLNQPTLSDQGPSSPSMAAPFQIDDDGMVHTPLYCICEQPFDGATFMLACDHCNQWFHGKCMGISEEDAKKAKTGYICDTCKARMATETPEGTLKRLREEGEAQATELMPSAKRLKKSQHQRGERFCRFPGCDKRITCRSYCSRHQKQKERAGKRGRIFSTSTSLGRKTGTVGRPSKSFSQTRNQRQKLKRFDEKINDFAGGEGEGTAMLEKYLNSSYGQKRLPCTKGDRIAQKIGANAIALVTQLPPTSPLRKPLIKALGESLSQSEIADTFHVSRKTVERSLALSVDENLLFTLVSRPRKLKSEQGEDTLATDDDMDIQQQQQPQSQPQQQPPPPHHHHHHHPHEQDPASLVHEQALQHQTLEEQLHAHHHHHHHHHHPQQLHLQHQHHDDGLDHQHSVGLQADDEQQVVHLEQQALEQQRVLEHQRRALEEHQQQVGLSPQDHLDPHHHHQQQQAVLERQRRVLEEHQQQVLRMQHEQALRLQQEQAMEEHHRAMEATHHHQHVLEHSHQQHHHPHSHQSEPHHVHASARSYHHPSEQVLLEGDVVVPVFNDEDALPS